MNIGVEKLDMHKGITIKALLNSSAICKRTSRVMLSKF